MNPVLGRKGRDIITNKPLRIPVSCGRCVMWGDDKDAGQRFRKCRAIAHGVVKFDDDYNPILVDKRHERADRGRICARWELFTLPQSTLTLD
jgi:hypothetical protein